jgi:amino acid adenylation domain-containing protein
LLGQLVDKPRNCVFDEAATPVEANRKFDPPVLPNSTNDNQATLVSLLLEAIQANRASGALKEAELSWTYDRLGVAVDERAKSLLRTIRPDQQQFLPVIGPSGANTFIAILAAIRSGFAVVPIDIDQPAIERVELLADTKAAFVFESPFELQIAGLEKIAKSEGLVIDGTTPSDLAYMIYTSGSTGRPKGVLVEHRAICNTLQWRRGAIPLSSSDRVLMLLSHQFDAGLGIALATVTSGAQLVWCDAAAKHDTSRLIDQLIRDQITVLPAIPSLLQLLVEHPRFIECTCIRQLWTGGEAMTRELPELVRQRTKATLWNLYGPTEAAVEAIACEVTTHDARRPVPLGRAIANTDILVVDDQLQPVPTSFPGQLAIAGMGLARGYLGLPELTEQRFRNIRLADGATKRFYLTGDRGRQLPDGNFEFLGRTDHQIKLRGYRLELEEIERHFEAHPMVERAAIKVQDERSANAKMVMHLQLNADVRARPELQPRTLAAEIRRTLASKLPSYKMPAHLVIAPSLPLTTSGKVDRKRLPNVEVSASERVYVAPGTPLETYLAKAWCESLGLERISVDQDFFQLGGSSLQAAMLTSKLTTDLGVHVPTSLLFDLADISKVGQRLVQLYEVQMAERFGMPSVTYYASRGEFSGSSNGQSGSIHPLIAPLKTSGQRSPIFLVHPPGGIVLCYRELASRIDEDQPIFGIRSRGLHGQEKLPSSIEESAVDYIEAMRSIQASGPYTVGGWSLGGIFAYEIALQLTSQGEEVEQLILMDTTIPEGASPLVDRSEQVHVGREYGVDFSLLELNNLKPEEQLPFLWEHAKRLGVLNDQTPPEIIDQVLSDLKKLFHHHLFLATRYKMRSFGGRILLIRPKDVPIQVKTSEDRGWRNLVRQVDVRFISGHHHSMVQMPHVLEMAQVISLAKVH